ncbi:hypothetical protein DMENIID0001_061880 [Sergentomyia squamirostris]
MFNALEFVPPRHVQKTFQDLQTFDFFVSEDENWDDDFREFLDYFDRTWMGSTGKAILTSYKWNGFEAFRDGLPKTSNNVDG